MCLEGNTARHSEALLGGTCMVTVPALRYLSVVLLAGKATLLLHHAMPHQLSRCLILSTHAFESLLFFSRMVISRQRSAPPRCCKETRMKQLREIHPAETWQTLSSAWSTASGERRELPNESAFKALKPLWSRHAWGNLARRPGPDDEQTISPERGLPMGSSQTRSRQQSAAKRIHP